jgi:hypothetical protein
MSYALASASGLMFGFWFFLILSAAIAFIIYGLLSWPSVRRHELGLGIVRKAIAIPMASLIGVVIFAAIFLSSLAGFHTVTIGNDDVTLAYAVPPLSVSMRYAEIGDVIRMPAYKSRWRLVVYTATGQKFESAPGSYRPVKEAAEEISRRRQSDHARSTPPRSTARSTPP